jgi:hypothetical protein
MNTDSFMELFEYYTELNKLHKYNFIKFHRIYKKITKKRREFYECDPFYLGERLFSLLNACSSYYSSDEFKISDGIVSFKVRMDAKDIEVKFSMWSNRYSVVDNNHNIEYEVMKDKELPRKINELWKPLSDHIVTMYAFEITRCIDNCVLSWKV